MDGGEPKLMRVETAAEFMRETYLSKKSANFSEAGQGLPLQNMSGAAVKKEEIDKWNEFEDSTQDY
jgi:hypothetical protein